MDKFIMDLCCAGLCPDWLCFRRLLAVLGWYRNVLFSTFLSLVYTGTYYLRGFWARCIPERIIFDVFEPGVYRNALFTNFFGQVHTGTLFLRAIFSDAQTATYYLLNWLGWPRPARPG